MPAKILATALFMAAVSLSSTFTAAAEPVIDENELIRIYLRDNAENDCRIMSNNPFDGDLLSTVVFTNAAIYRISEKQAFGLMTIAAKTFCPDVLERWQYGPAPQG